MADNRISNLPTTSALTLEDLLETEQPAQAAGTRSRKTTIAQLLALIFDDDPTLAGDSDDKAATQAAVKAFVEDAIADAMAALAPPSAAVAMQFIADTSGTSDADPGAGKLRWNHGTQGSASMLFLDDSSDDGVSLTGLWPALHAGGTIFLQHATDLDTWQIWEVTAITDASGYAKLAVTNLVNGGTFANGDAILVAIDRAQVNTGGVSTVNGASGAVVIHAFAQVMLSNMTTDLTTGTKKAVWWAPEDGQLVDVWFAVEDPSSSGVVRIDMNDSGGSVFTTRPSIDATESTSLTGTAAVLDGTISFAKGDKFTFDIDDAGTDAKGLMVTVEYAPT